VLLAQGIGKFVDKHGKLGYFRFRVPGAGFRVPGSRFRVPGSRFRVPGSGFRVPGSGSWFQVPGSKAPTGTT
jgi:hypothetical protein